MENNTEYNIYEDIARRTNGDVYIGVVGPVRTGKSTFIASFAKRYVLPLITDENERARAIDEVPQSADGKVVMTTKPQFVPNRALAVKIDNQIEARVRLIDCVGYVTADADLGSDENGERLVDTPWDSSPMPFSKAAEIGTEKVIREHSTVAIVLTTDGSIKTGLARNNYIEAEERAINELKRIGKPFVIVVNSASPESEEANRLKKSLELKHNTKTMVINAANLRDENVNEIFSGILEEFPLTSVDVKLPAFLEALPINNKYVLDVISQLKEKSVGKVKINEFSSMLLFESNDDFKITKAPRVMMDEGRVVFELEAQEGLFYKVVSSEVGFEIKNDFDLVSCLKTLSVENKKFAQIQTAFDEAEAVGYGISSPIKASLSLNEPEILKQGGRFGVKLTATAPSYHIVKVDIATEVNPILGTEEQSESLIKELSDKFKESPSELWNTNIFGKSLESLAMEGLYGKVSVMPQVAKEKLRKTTSKIVNENKGGIICILL